MKTKLLLLLVLLFDFTSIIFAQTTPVVNTKQKV